MPLALISHLLRDARRSAWTHAVAGMVVGLLVLVVGLYGRWLEASEREAMARAEATAAGAVIGANISRELNSALYLTSGVRSYLVVRGGRIDGSELHGILADLHGASAHVRNFGIAQGVRVVQVFPVKGNEKAIGLNYHELPTQWPDVKHVIETGRPRLVGPIPLVQGGSGLVYRVPVVINGSYWGLVSTVIDSVSLLSAALGDERSAGFEVAVRGRHAQGALGEVFHGRSEVFVRPDVALVHVPVPDGEWVLGLVPRQTTGWGAALWWYLGIACVALALGMGTTVILHQRAELGHRALRDILTGLPNRQLIEDRLQLALARQRRSGQLVFGLLFIDLDGFKAINDRHGHKAGDGVLRAVAERLVRAVRETDLVGRWGGDEFAVVLDACEPEAIDESVARIRRAVELSVEVEGHWCPVGASIGVALVPEDGASVTALLRVADERMYADKARRKPVAAG